MVLQSSLNFSFDNWREFVAENIIDSFLTKSKMIDLFDDFTESDVSLPEGYSHGYSFRNSDFYWCIAYHEAFIKMGVIVKFSAFSWHEYRKRYEAKYNEPIHLHTFFNLITDDTYSFRLSRIDMCCDFFNENIDISQLKRSIEQGRTEVRYAEF